MCGIGGFSLSTKSTINPKSLSNALLSEMDIRGNQASGFAYRSDTKSGLYKKAVSGASLSLRTMPKKATDVLLHTRFATHGSIQNPVNNHPIQSPDETISLVHNGVIYNHDLIRTEIDTLDMLPEVDTSVIPAILQRYNRNFDKLNMLDGDASIAWLDSKDEKTLWVARISHSPLVIGQMADGSFIFASTESIMLNALEKINLLDQLNYCESMPERTILGIRNGRMDIVQAIPELDPAYQDSSWYGSYGNFRNMTSGGHKTIGKPMSARDQYEEEFGEFSDYNGYSLAEWEEQESQSSTGSNTTPKYVRFQSAWGDIVTPSKSKPFRYPVLPNYTVNEYGEYFDQAGHFVGDSETMQEMGAWDEWALDY
jgi:hypothetical protein